MSALRELHPLVQVLLATLLTWSIPTLGAALVFTTKELSQRVLDGFLGFAAGVMIFMVVKEVVPESQRRGDTDLPTAGAIVGFVVMMVWMWRWDRGLTGDHRPLTNRPVDR